MSIAARLYLAIVALLIAGFMIVDGHGFSSTADQLPAATQSVTTWIVMACISTAALWLPAAIPPRRRVLSHVVRWLSAIALLIPVRIFVFMTAELAASGPGALDGGQRIMIALTGACTVAIGVLLWPDVRSSLRTLRRPRESDG